MFRKIICFVKMWENKWYDDLILWFRYIIHNALIGTPFLEWPRPIYKFWLPTYHLDNLEKLFNFSEPYFLISKMGLIWNIITECSWPLNRHHTRTGSSGGKKTSTVHSNRRLYLTTGQHTIRNNLNVSQGIYSWNVKYLCYGLLSGK